MESKLQIQAMPIDWLRKDPPPRDWVLENTIPGGSVTVIAGAGGSGKTYLMLDLSVQSAAGGLRFLGMRLNGGSTCIVSAEDRMSDYQSRLYALHRRYAEYLTRSGKTLKEIAKLLKEREERLAANLHILPAVGIDLHLIAMTGGSVHQSVDLDVLIAKLKDVPGLRLIILDPLARLHGLDENSNGVMTAAISAAERIATETGAAVLVVHHVSKDAASKKSTHAHVGRGGSALSDGARSVLVMQSVDSPPSGRRLLHDGFGGAIAEVDNKMYASGRVVQLVHAKANHAPRQPDMFLLRDEASGALRLLTVKGIDAPQESVAKLRRWVGGDHDEDSYERAD